MVGVQAERFSLHFEIPAVPDGTAAQLAVVGDISGRVRPMHLADACPQLPQFLDERLQRLADAPERAAARSSISSSSILP